MPSLTVTVGVGVNVGVGVGDAPLITQSNIASKFKVSHTSVGVGVTSGQLDEKKLESKSGQTEKLGDAP